MAVRLRRQEMVRLVTATCGTGTNLPKTAGVAVPSAAKVAENAREDVDGKFDQNTSSATIFALTPFLWCSDASINPGNNLHVSGLAHKVDNRELENAFSKYGKVGHVTSYFVWYLQFVYEGRPGCHYV